MLFNSYEFILFFLPTVLIGYFVLGSRLGREPAIVWLVAGSLFFYGWWNPIYLLLLAGSMVVNFGLGKAITRRLEAGAGTRALLILGIALILGAALLLYGRRRRIA